MTTRLVFRRGPLPHSRQTSPSQPASRRNGYHLALELDAARDFVRECLIIESSLREYAVTDPYGQDDAYIIDRLVKLDGVLVQVDGAVKLILDAIRPDAVVEAARCPERSYHEVGIAIARRTASWARSPIVNAARLARPWNAPNLSFPLPVLSEPLTADNLARCWTPRTWDRLRDVLLVIPNYNRDLFFKQIDAEHALACKAIAVGSPTLPRSSADGWMPVGRAVEIAHEHGFEAGKSPEHQQVGSSRQYSGSPARTARSA